MRRAPSEAAAPEPAHTGAATLADEIASAQNGAGPLMGRIRKPDAREALAYMRAHSSAEGELLEGLSKFVERWLEQVRLHGPASFSPVLRGFDCTLRAPLLGRGTPMSCGCHVRSQYCLLLRRWRSRSSGTLLSSHPRPRCMLTMM